MSPKLGETIHLDFITSASTGAAADADSTPTAEVFEDATDTAILSPTVTKRTSKTGNYRIPVACTAANGFEEGKTYNVIASATVGGVAAKAKIASFQVRTTYAASGNWNTVAPDNASITLIKSQTDKLYFTSQDGEFLVKSDQRSIGGSKDASGAANEFFNIICGAHTQSDFDSVTGLKTLGFDYFTDGLVPTSGGGSSSVGTGDIAVNHDTGGDDNLRAATAGGVGIDEVTVRAYLKADYDAGNFTVRGEVKTGTDGRWVENMMLNAGVYRFVFTRDGYATSSLEETVA